MAAEDSRAIRSREQRTAPAAKWAKPVPAIKWDDPLINSVPDALEDAGYSFERLRNLLDSNNSALNEHIYAIGDYLRSADGCPVAYQKHAYSIWMTFIVVSEKLEELQKVIDAVADRINTDNARAQA